MILTVFLQDFCGTAAGSLRKSNDGQIAQAWIPGSDNARFVVQGVIATPARHARRPIVRAGSDTLMPPGFGLQRIASVFVQERRALVQREPVVRTGIVVRPQGPGGPCVGYPAIDPDCRPRDEGGGLGQQENDRGGNFGFGAVALQRHSVPEGLEVLAKFRRIRVEAT